MSPLRKCSRTTCQQPAVATLTYQYAEATAVIGPLSPVAAPGTFDLCEAHAESVTVPRGWQMIRLRTEFEPAPPSDTDLMALADAIRETATRQPPEPTRATRRVSRPSDVAVRPRLSVVRGEEPETPAAD
ncbi:DUF3499 domain-containing protein [Actinotignum sanguinis]|uniref:DUF3499 domain-containing protein n=2 Tax=Actinomycetaceae TaxID=2049 RepID=A0ABZ0R9T0_9ACTO|nr:MULTISPECIES: DUF3499 domain-containing protein [Actinotignum]WPJ88278.1 DUF3499 domain-containing protein [Schaalia turicensis]MDE1552408.1 DUF3499 domain-containing protein [Actinotignum sanguinis]MDE1565076.1 DUF3499 domain-containing protein [Actinotignum sanguinis]MDE1576487.1 DUF3499 domain-containing protein [Actinotignum sanguinis]MDE1641948.1 DUF3499 domain-containing protein [Actinotignum sanguinis]